MSKSRRNRRFEYSNQHAAIQVQPNYDAFIGGVSYTANRDDAAFFAEISTDSSNSTDLLVNLGQAGIRLSGRQARTLQRLLNKHYTTVGASQSAPGAE